MKPFLLVAACFLLTGVSAQSTPWSFTLSAGPAIPVGNFAKGDPHDLTAGNASLGVNVQAGVAYHVYRNWGFVLLAGYQTNRNDWYTPSSGGDEHYTFWKLLAGPTYTRTFDKHWAVTARAMEGVEQLTPLFKKGRPTPFHWGGGIGLRYKLPKHWFIDGTADYLQALHHSIATVYANNQFYTQAAVTDAFNTINTAIGIGYSL